MASQYLLFCEGNAEMTYFVHSPALDRLPTHNLQCPISDSFQKKMGRGNFVNANDINCYIPISYG